MSVVHGGDVWRGGRPGDWLDFSASLNPDGPPDWVRAALAAGLENAGYYPDPRSESARAGLAAHAGVSPECVRLFRARYPTSTVSALMRTLP